MRKLRPLRWLNRNWPALLEALLKIWAENERRRRRRP